MKNLIFLVSSLISILSSAQTNTFPLSHKFFDANEINFLKKDINTSFRPVIFSKKDSLENMFRKKYYEIHSIKYSNFKYQNENYAFLISPLVNLSYSKSKKESFSNNSRGLMIKGSIGNKLSFESFFLENQSFFPTFLDSIVRSVPMSGVEIVPGQGEARIFKENGYDYSRSEGFFSYKINRNIIIQFGHGKHFIGNGYRSLILSDNSYPYPFLRLQTSLGIFRYTNLFTEFMDIRNNQLSIIKGFDSWSRKYMSLHFLECNLTKKLKLGIFESVVYAENHAPGVSSIDLNYLNPIIFYRPVEYSLRSPDNVLLGIDLKFRTNMSQFLYAQFILDEFTLSEIKSNSGYWANKYGYQIGYKVLNFFNIIGLNTNFEYNLVRPYTYSHWNSSSYGHYAQPLAHPLGANFDESVIKIDYTFNRLGFNLKYNYARVGLDDTQNDSISYGSDIFLNYSLRSDDYGIQQFNGIKASIKNFKFHISYLIDYKNNLKIGFFISNRSFVYKGYENNETYSGIYIKTDLFNYYYDR